ncbi:hypothetical protein, partial [Aneurinibacillus aneurinilyticus]|uniref:hypothetical protein n=1 Tax=Aneurinibacillus aneurinilyticus TaxID=1391 RepID=UPI003C6C048D
WRSYCTFDIFIATSRVGLPLHAALIVGLLTPIRRAKSFCRILRSTSINLSLDLIAKYDHLTVLIRQLAGFSFSHGFNYDNARYYT